MRSRELRVLLRKDLSELRASRAFWLLLLIIGLLAGQSFATAVRSYAEASGPGALAQGLSPLDGIVTPVMGAYDLAIMLLFPFVAIRLVASEKSSDAWKLMLQWPASLSLQLTSKVIALLAVWIVSLVPLFGALALWSGYGGHLHGPETANVLFGYTLRFVLTAALSMAAAALMPGAANAAVLVLAFTIGTWALDFLAAGRGGMVQWIASYTPTATLRSFERGLLRLDAVLVILLLSVALLGLTVVWLRLGLPFRVVVKRTAICVVAGAIAVFFASRVSTTWDVSENQRNSFSRADERALEQIDKPLKITLRLAAEDPRMTDYESHVLIRLRRALPAVSVSYPLEGRTALFDNDEHYGEITYELGGQRATNRSTTEEIVLDTIYELAKISPPQREESAYPGYPLATTARGSAVVFYLVWPVIVLLAWWRSGARRSLRTG